MTCLGLAPKSATYILICVGLCVPRGSSFNVETDFFVAHRGPPESKFGFSLAFHKDPDGPRILVGAPEAETLVPGVTKGGAVFKCHPQIQDHCHIIPFDNKGNHHDGLQYMDDKSHQWFGASVTSRSGVAAACAPRYVWFSVKKNRREPIGSCFILTTSKGPDRFKPYTPCMTNSWGYHRQGTCQAGFGLALSRGGNKVYVGAVGSWYWQGQVFYQNLLNMQEKLSTAEAPKEFDMGYMGFSLCMGRFNGDTEEGVAVGVPRGSNLKGMVAIFDHKLNLIYNLRGKQMGSYFGYSVTSLDFDGDGLIDIVVGAPWNTRDSNIDGIYEEGAVFLFKHTQQQNFRRTLQLSGRSSRSHFGLSLASLKDVNDDGFEDLAVGAPGGGEGGSGAVFIFLGGAEGLRVKPAQILYVEELTNVPTKTFGWALSGGMDVDLNGYPDLAVGAHENNKVFVFRTRPVVAVNGSVKIKSTSGVFDLESLVCSLQDNTDVACYPVHYCLSYTGKGVPAQLNMFLSLRLDSSSTEQSSRIFFLKREGGATFQGSMVLNKDVQKCSSQYIYAVPVVHDKLTPIVTELSYSLSHSDESAVDPLVLRPIMAPSPFGGDNLVKDVIYFQNNCGVDNVCIPDLKGRMTIKASNYTLGSSQDIILELRVLNHGEDAYRSRVFVRVPNGVHFGKFLVSYNGSPEEVTPFCTTIIKAPPTPTSAEDGLEGDEEVDLEEKFQREENEFKELEVMLCEIGNPLPSRSGVGLRLHFQPSPTLIHFDHLKFELVVNSTNEEINTTLGDNFLSFHLPVVMESDVSIRGISWPDADFNYNASLFGENLVGSDQLIEHEKEAGPEVSHIYDVVNRGPSDLPNVEIYLLWPTRTIVGDPLLYLTEIPIVTPKTIDCEAPNAVNYLNLVVDVSPYDAALISANMLHSDSFDLRWRRSIRDDTVRLQMVERLQQNASVEEEKLEDLEDLLSCGSTNCSIMKCFIPLFKADDNFIIRVRSRLWVDTIEKLGLANLKISSRLVVYSRGNLNSSVSKGLSWSKSVTSIIKTRLETPVTSLSWLIWLGSALVGLIVLALLIFMLWMVGFFKRRRPTPERS